MKEKAMVFDAAGWSYLAMLGFTFITFLVGEAHQDSLLLSLGVLGVAMVKGHLMGDYFMGLAKVRGLWRWVVLIWLLLPAILISTAFMLAA